MAERPKIVVENANLTWRNFAGAKKKYNAEGLRNFCVMLDDDTAQRMEADGWSVKYTTPKEEGDIPQPFIKVNVKYDFKPPQIVMITSKARTLLTEDTVEVLDYAELKIVDFVAVGSDWKMDDGRTGMSAYLKTMFVTLDEDELQLKYAVEGKNPLGLDTEVPEDLVTG